LLDETLAEQRAGKPDSASRSGEPQFTESETPVLPQTRDAPSTLKSETIYDDLGVDAGERARDSAAERYFAKDLDGQRQWFSERAQSYKRRSEFLALLVIGLGAAVTFIQVLGAAPWMAILSGSIGAVVAIAAGWERIAR
jgi:hypothetical protein